MASEIAIAMLKADLGRTGNIPQELLTYMGQLIDVATARLSRDGIFVDEANPSDLNLLTMYAAWLYRRRDTGEGKPMMLRQAINDAQVHKATGGST